MNARVSLVVVGLLGIAACGGGDDGPPPPNPGLPDVFSVPVDRVDAMITVSPQFLQLHTQKPVSAVLALDVDASGGVTGSMSFLSPSTLRGVPNSPRPVTGRFAGGHLTLDPGSASIFLGEYPDTFAWTQLTITVGEDGRLDSGSGTAIGAWTSSSSGDILSPALDFIATIAATADQVGAVIDVVHTEEEDGTTMFPTDLVSVRLGEPVDAAQAAKLRVVVNDVPVAGSLTPAAPLVTGLVTEMAFQSPTFWPFGGAISTDPNGLTDPSGNALVARPFQERVVEDPGPITANPSFEHDLTGWLRKGRGTGIWGSSATMDPVEGANQMFVISGEQLAGYFDVPADATALSISVGMLFRVEPDQRAEVKATVVVQRASGEHIVVYDGQAEQARGAPCACENFNARVAPTAKIVDLTPYRGERLFVIAAVAPAGWDTGDVTLALDDLRIQ